MPHVALSIPRQGRTTETQTGFLAQKSARAKVRPLQEPATQCPAAEVAYNAKNAENAGHALNDMQDEEAGSGASPECRKEARCDDPSIALRRWRNQKKKAGGMQRVDQQPARDDEQIGQLEGKSAVIIVERKAQLGYRSAKLPKSHS